MNNKRIQKIDVAPKELRIGRAYWFDKSRQSKGVFVGRNEDEVVFELIGENNGYIIKDGLISFSLDFPIYFDEYNFEVKLPLSIRDIVITSVEKHMSALVKELDFTFDLEKVGITPSQDIEMYNLKVSLSEVLHDYVRDNMQH